MATRVWVGMRREEYDRRGVAWSSGCECLAPRSFDRLLSGKASVIETGSSAAEMFGNLDHRLAVAFRLRTRRPAGENG